MNPPPGSDRSRKKPATRSADDCSSVGASRATCSISSLKLTAPALQLDVVENLADDAAKQALERRLIEHGERADRLLLVGLEQAAAAILDVQLDQPGAQRVRRVAGVAPPCRQQRGVRRLVLALRAVDADRERQRRPQ